MNKAAKSQSLMREIVKVTSQIQVQFPELYLLLNETPQLYSKSRKCPFVDDLEFYLNSITLQLNGFKKYEKKTTSTL